MVEPKPEPRARGNPDETFAGKGGTCTSKRAVPKTGARLTAGRTRQHKHPYRQREPSDECTGPLA